MTYRPEDTKFDARERYADIHETIREHPLKSDRKVVVLCFECQNQPVVQSNNDNPDDVRCEVCKSKHKRRREIAANAKGGY